MGGHGEECEVWKRESGFDKLNEEVEESLEEL